MHSGNAFAPHVQELLPPLQAQRRRIQPQQRLQRGRDARRPPPRSPPSGSRCAPPSGSGITVVDQAQPLQILRRSASAPRPPSPPGPRRATGSRRSPPARSPNRSRAPASAPRSPAASAMAPPEPPSPMIVATIGTGASRQASIERAIASAWPRASASMPGKGAGGVDEGQQRQPEAAGQLDQPPRLAVALGPGHAEIMLHPAVGVGALLGAEHHHRRGRETGPGRRPPPRRRRRRGRRPAA